MNPVEQRLRLATRDAWTQGVARLLAAKYGRALPGLPEPAFVRARKGR